MSLVARHLEAAGLPTVVLGCAKDIVERCGVARFVFSDFPLGNSCGKPFDEASQRLTLELGLELLERAFAPRTTVQSPQRWSEDQSWKRDFMSLEGLGGTELAARRREFDRQKEIARERRSGSSGGAAG